MTAVDPTQTADRGEPRDALRASSQDRSGGADSDRKGFLAGLVLGADLEDQGIPSFRVETEISTSLKAVRDSIRGPAEQVRPGETTRVSA